MDRKRKHMIARWLLGVFIVTSLIPLPVRAMSAELEKTDQGAIYLPLLQKPAAAVDVAWPMAGANPQRTSWTAANISGDLALDWYRTITPYIPPRFQIIAANNTLYISSAKGLYALDASTGGQNWVFPTELPLGQSPTYASIGGENVLFVGGHDHRLYAIKDSGSSYQLKWTFKIGINSTLDPGEIPSGYDTNPLVINNTVYMGNRNGYVYAVNAATGSLIWKFKTNGRIDFSIAASANNSIVYVVSNDTYAYALNAANGNLVWKSVKLPTGDGFQSWWPVVHTAGNALIISSSRAVRVGVGPYNGDVFHQGSNYDPEYEPNSSLIPANRRASMTNAISYFNSLPYRRGYYFINLADGKEMVFDANNDGTRDLYPPLMFAGTNSGTRPPVIVGRDMLTNQFDLVYSFNIFTSQDYANGVAGWKLTNSSRWNEVITPPDGQSQHDEPMMYSASGNNIYYTICCDRKAGYYDTVSGNSWTLFNYNIENIAPDYNTLISGQGSNSESGAAYVFGDYNGVYGYHGDQNPPIPYNGRLYIHRGNSILAFGTTGKGTHLSTLAAPIVTPHTSPISLDALTSKLEAEIRKFDVDGNGALDHLRPGWGVLGGYAGANTGVGINNINYSDMSNYWHDPADTIYTLSLAYPLVQDVTLKNRLATYLQTEYANYSPCDYGDIGWSGSAREDFTLPPEITSALTAGKSSGNPPFGYFALYAMWKYVQAGLGDAATVFNACKNSLPPSSLDSEHPFISNAQIAGYKGYVELAKLAGQPYSSQEGTLNSMMSNRASGFAENNPWGGPAPAMPGNNRQALAVAQNFMWMTPELARYLYDHANSKVQIALDHYRTDAPYWFVSKFEATYREATNQHLYDNWALFAMKAWFAPANAQTKREELAKYLDAPAFARGDLFYIQNLVATIEAESVPLTSASIPLRSKTFTPGAPAPTNDLTALGPGKGYWLDMIDPAILQVNP
jgi:outer membrane protein assembly factor BamB